MFFIYIIMGNIAWALPSTSDRISIDNVVGPSAVKIIRRTGKEEQKSVGDELFLGDTIETTAKQIVSLQSYDGSVWKIAPETSIKLESRQPESNNFSYWIFSMVKGSLWGKVNPGSDKESYKVKIKTKTAAIGIRGTEYLMQGNDAEAEVDVLEGKVWWGPSEKFEPGSFIEVKAGEHAELRNKTISKPIPTIQKGQDLLRKYRLALDEDRKTANGEVQGVSSIEDCHHRGMGWKNKNGSRLGECYREQH